MLKKALFIMFLSLTSITLLAQQIKTISGVVTDAATGEALIGVAIQEPGTSNGTASDLDGNYTLNVKGDRISFSYVGYKSQVLTVQNASTLNVKLLSDSELDEVIVVGYTSQKKREVLGSLTNVKSKELTQLPVSNTTEALQGRVAGVQVTNTSGAPGSGATIRIRGAGSINSSNDPLYIIDGIPASNGLNSVIPTDIESISVLKDASASAIYGSRANNGIVLITTKKGKKGKAKVSYNGQFGAQVHGSLTEMANTSQYINIYNAAAKNDGRELLEGKWLRDDFANVNHLEEVFQTALMTIHDVSVSGANDKFNYLASGSYYNQEGIIKNSKFEKFTGSTNLGYQATKWLKIGLSANAGKSTTDIVPSSGDGYGNSEGGSVVRYAFMRNPAIPVYDKSGKFVDKPSEYFGHPMYDTFFGEGYNPLGVAEMADRKRDETMVLSKLNVEVKLPYNTIWNNNFGIDYKKSELSAYNRTWGTGDRINNPSSRSFNNNEELGWTLNSVLSNTHTFNEAHRLTSMIGTEAIRYNGTSKDGGTNKDGELQYSADYASSLLSFFGKVDYNYNYKYYLSALIRHDGSSRFAEGNRWGTFYALSAGWDVNEEEFFKPLTPVVNLMKLRAGWGAVGNQEIGLYAFVDKFMPYANYPFGGNPSLGYTQTQLGNTDLQWETSKQLNLGLDMAFLDGEYGFSADYYHKVTKDLLIKAPLPPSIGNAAPFWMNSGEILNEGVDLEVYMRKQYKNAGFSIALNWGYLKNEVLKVNAPISGGRVDTGIDAKLIEEGYSLGSYYLYEMDGIFQNESEIVRSAYQGANIQPGDVKYKDLNGDGVIDEKDRRHIGSSIPNQTLGLNLQGNLSNWDVSIFFQGAFGNEIYNQIGHETEGFYRGFNVTKDYYDNYWRGEGTSNTHPRASWNAKSNNVMVSSRFLEDASYLRLKNLQVGYTFALKSKLISNFRVFGSATNLLTFTKYSGLDPEMTVSANASGEGDRSNGIDWGTYPVAKTFTLGVNLTF
ncbi:TonB-linked SusC/RagA family outer membrane protein [Dysgonomonas alginatilytica]|uniref:TonB-linked SusC/RagA family outer membrane protein n=1 Tax=Dysgonomonas alginatilytica TaxID=1605892 RepID=A0A2V3PL62_9BACT|nr:TonB-dependent receptor [Dysgonomonas alginatilytica]PXV59363.1 TonB-linked SusC/RagA family outer membrane protein [Dysgonomonas alginatilytica]